jgi:hypothetical protein
MSLDDETIFPPTSEVWTSHRVSWQITDPTRAQYPREISENRIPATDIGMGL